MNTELERKCNKCNTIKPVSDFYKDRPNGSKRYECKQCHLSYYKERWASADKTYRKDRFKSHRKNLLGKYNLSPDDYAKLVENQGGCCAVCDVKPDELLFVDHCHESGLVRGLLCRRCNMGLGMLGDDLSGIERAYQYMRKHYEDGCD